MSRAKYDESNPYNLLIWKIGYFKINYSDFLYDFRYIYKDILDYFGNSIVPYDKKVKELLDIVSTANVKPSFKNRIYIITDIYEVVLAVVDIDEDVFDNLVNTFDFWEGLDPLRPEKIILTYATTMYLFKGEELVKIHSLNTMKLAEFMAVFKNENIVNYQGARDTWYAEPRRKAKQKKSF